MTLEYVKALTWEYRTGDVNVVSVDLFLSVWQNVTIRLIVITNDFHSVIFGDLL